MLSHATLGPDQQEKWGPTYTTPSMAHIQLDDRSLPRAKANSKFAVYERFRAHASAELVQIDSSQVSNSNMTVLDRVAVDMHGTRNSA